MDAFLPLARACAAARIPYVRAWAAITRGALHCERRGGRLFVRPTELARVCGDGAEAHT